MHLEKHLKETGQSQGTFGARLNPPASQSLMSQWIRGITRITLDYALQIERESTGAVTPKDCAEMFSDPVSRQQPIALSSAAPASPSHA